MSSLIASKFTERLRKRPTRCLAAITFEALASILWREIRPLFTAAIQRANTSFRVTRHQQHVGPRFNRPHGRFAWRVQ